MKSRRRNVLRRARSSLVTGAALPWHPAKVEISNLPSVEPYLFMFFPIAGAGVTICRRARDRTVDFQGHIYRIQIDGRRRKWKFWLWGAGEYIMRYALRDEIFRGCYADTVHQGILSMAGPRVVYTIATRWMTPRRNKKARVFFTK